MTSPQVTVLLPAYNAAKWVRQAIKSVLSQSLANFELLIVNDGSTDGTANILREFSDPRIRVITHEPNWGLIRTLNLGLEHARGALIARMDADDIAHPKRLEYQARFMNENPAIGICGTWFRVCRRWRVTRVRPPTTHDLIAARLFFRSPFGHPTVMMRAAVLARHGLRYDPEAEHAEDFDLWARACDHTRLANLPRFLLDYRVHDEQISARHLRKQHEAASRVRLRQLMKLLPNASDEEKLRHARVCDGYIFRSVDELLVARAWLDKLAAVNQSKCIYPVEAFGAALSHAWYQCCLRATLSPHQIIGAHWSRRYSTLDAQQWRERLHVGARSMLFRASCS